MTPSDRDIFEQAIAMLQAEADERESRAPMMRQLAKDLHKHAYEPDSKQQEK